MSHVTITARRMAPSVTGAGAGVVRSVCQPWSSWCTDRAPRVAEWRARGGRRRLECVHDVHDEREQAEAGGDCGRPATVPPERPDHEREERGAEHWEHEPAAVEHAGERQGRAGAERGERERR